MLALLLPLGGCCGSKISGLASNGGTGTGTTSAGTTGDGPPACPPGTFTAVPGPLTQRSFAGAAFGADGLAYVAGGTPYAGSVTALVEVLNPDSGVVSTGPPMLAPRSGFGLVASLDRRTLYAIGGEYPGASPRAESFDVATQIWSTLPELPLSEGGAFAGVLADGRVVAVFPDILAPNGGARVEVLVDGGWIDGPELLERFPDNGLFESGPWQAPAYGAAAVGNAFFAVEGELNLAAWAAAAADAGWMQVAAPPQAELLRFRRNPSLAAGAQLLLVTGGLEVGADCAGPEGALFALDPSDLDAGWLALPRAPTPRDSATAAVSPDARLFVFGGEAISECCRSSRVEISTTIYSSYDVFNLDAGTWEPSHTR